MELRLTVNGRLHTLEVEPQARLLDVLRERLALTGAKEGCGEGECGACTVLMDDLAVNSCLVLAHQARGKRIVTVEGLAGRGELDLLQEKFVASGAIQCGYCTPGMLMSAKALLLREPSPSEEEIRLALAGNLCRCTGYVNIIKAVREAADAGYGENRPGALAAREAEAGPAPGKSAHGFKGYGPAEGEWPLFRLVCPTGLDETLKAVSEISGEIAFLSGGTDLILRLNEGLCHPDWLVDLSQLDELKYIREEKGSLRIGGTTTFASVAASPLLREKARCLAQAAAQVGSPQIRNRATLAGNIVTASAAGDSLPALSVLEARVDIFGPAGRRKMPLTQFLEAPSQALRRGEFVGGVDFPAPAGEIGRRTISAFGKIGSRRTVTIAKLNMALRLELESESGRILSAGVALGALGKAPLRPREVERGLCGRRADEGLQSALADGLAEAVDQAIPGRPSRAYKREAIRGLVDDVWKDLMRQIGPPGGGGETKREKGGGHRAERERARAGTEEGAGSKEGARSKEGAGSEEGEGSKEGSGVSVTLVASVPAECAGGGKSREGSR